MIFFRFRQILLRTFALVVAEEHVYGAGIVGAFQYELDEFVNVFGSIGEVLPSLQRVVQHGFQVAYAQGEALHSDR